MEFLDFHPIDSNRIDSLFDFDFESIFYFMLFLTILLHILFGYIFVSLYLSLWDLTSLTIIFYFVI